MSEDEMAGWHHPCRMAIEDEENWLRNSDRSYAVVEERMKEVEDRKNTIMQGVKALIADCGR